jgi:hypothetical protein
MRNYLTALLMLLTVGLVGQPRFPVLSPEGSIRQKVGLTTISVIYERPSARGRKIFGDLVPYGKLWRTGAGNCTKIKIDGAVVIGNSVVPSGTYALLTIPGQNEWTIIFNSDTTLYGTQGYDESKDVVRFKSKPEMTVRHYESFTINIDVVQNDAELNLSWEKTHVAFKIKTETDQLVMEMVTEDLLSGKIKDPQLLAMGAEYYYFLDRDLETGIALINKALDYKQTSWYYALKVDLLTKRKQYTEAIETLKLNMAYVKTNPERWTEEQLNNVLEGQEIQMRELQKKTKEAHPDYGK